MLKKVSIIAALLCMAASFNARAQIVDVIGGYIFAGESSGVAATIQAYGQDGFGDTYVRSDFAFKKEPFSLATAYLEAARTLVFWKNTKFKDIGIHAEFNGYLNMDNCNWLFGLDYTLPLKDLVKVSLLYKTFNGGAFATVPVQLSVLWDMKTYSVSRAWNSKARQRYGERIPNTGITMRIPWLMRPPTSK